MKKLRSNGGYALVYVVAAMTLMLAIVGGVTVTASRNLQTQQSAVSMMEERYEAAGKVEEIFAKIASFKPEPTVITSNDFKIEDVFSEFELADFKDTGDDSFTAKIKGESDNTTVTADILVKYTVTSEATDPGEESYTYTVTVTSVSYVSYEVKYKEST